MEINIKVTPEEIAKLLQAIGSSKEQYKNDLIDIEFDGKKISEVQILRTSDKQSQ
ncbi:hypothetical protein IGI96_000942 [Enterococcus sp. DIV0421]|uniref:hypothetical protein n=1 Tax=Enterococcus sp. DIV0421 TaxID=2774688 RepID=UPI003F26C957